MGMLKTRETDWHSGLKLNADWAGQMDGALGYSLNSNGARLVADGSCPFSGEINGLDRKKIEAYRELLPIARTTGQLARGFSLREPTIDRINLIFDPGGGGNTLLFPVKRFAVPREFSAESTVTHIAQEVIPFIDGKLKKTYGKAVEDPTQLVSAKQLHEQDPIAMNILGVHQGLILLGEAVAKLRCHFEDVGIFPTVEAMRDGMEQVKPSIVAMAGLNERTLSILDALHIMRVGAIRLQAKEGDALKVEVCVDERVHNLIMSFSDVAHDLFPNGHRNHFMIFRMIEVLGAYDLIPHGYVEETKKVFLAALNVSRSSPERAKTKIRNDCYAAELVESDRPFDETMWYARRMAEAACQLSNSAFIHYFKPKAGNTITCPFLAGGKGMFNTWYDDTSDLLIRATDWSCSAERYSL